MSDNVKEQILLILGVTIGGILSSLYLCYGHGIRSELKYQADLLKYQADLAAKCPHPERIISEEKNGRLPGFKPIFTRVQAYYEQNHSKE